MVADKMHSREYGPVQLLTRQPAEGRSRDGGLRMGEMERDVFIAHGIPKFLKERMMDSSDIFKVYVSKKHETIIVGNPEEQLYKLGNDILKDDEVYQIQIPYAMKLLIHELESMGIDIGLNVTGS
jgi:DNA-directed RNA polymerase beta subunit